MASTTSSACTDSSEEMERRQSAPAPEASFATGKWEQRQHVLTPGSLEDHYELKETVLGHGMSGLVRLAEHRWTGEKVAVKTFELRALPLRYKHDMCREMGVHSALDHPNVARVRASFWSARKGFGHIVTEYLDGGTVLDQIKEQECINECQARIVVTQLLQAVEYLHGLGLCHRDIKVENMLYTDEARDQVKLIDFGLCCKWREGRVPMSRVCGTKGYIAPEVLTASYTNKADMWSLGVTVHAMLTGDIIGRSRDGSAVMSKKLRLCSPKAQRFVEALLALDPAARASATEALSHDWLQENPKIDHSRKRSSTEGTVSTVATLSPTENCSQNIFSQASMDNDDAARRYARAQTSLKEQGLVSSQNHLEALDTQENRLEALDTQDDHDNHEALDAEDNKPSRPRKASGIVRLVHTLWSAIRRKKASAVAPLAPGTMDSIVPSAGAR